jgi:transcriptional regulator with XRE-family HTH domain
MARKRWQLDLGEQIRKAREARAMTQAALAKDLKIERGSLYLYETGKGNPQFRIVAQIAALLKADFNVLGCRIVARELSKTTEDPPEQLELALDQDHSFLANVTIRPSKKSITITTHSDYGIKSG